MSYETTLITIPAVGNLPFPFVEKPRCLLTFSYDPSRVLRFDNSSMKYYRQPPVGASLAKDYENWIKRPEARTRLDGILECLIRSEVESEAKQADVITWRGIMTKIITCAFEMRDSWDLNVMMVNGTLYMEEHATPEIVSQQENMTSEHRLFSYYGYAFESYCTADVPFGTGDADGWGGTVDTNVQWAAIVKTEISDLRVVIGGEVDCVRDVFTGQPDTFVELKTTKTLRPGHFYDRKNLRKKIMKFWAQSFLLGIPEVVIGYRTPDGYIAQVDSLRTLDLPTYLKDRRYAKDDWNPSVCLNYGVRLLHQVIDHISKSQRSKQDHSRTWRISFRPSSPIQLRELRPDEVADVTEGEDRVGFLPSNYFEALQ